MKDLYKLYLANRGVLVSEKEEHENVFEVLFTLMKKFGIEVEEGCDLAEPDMIRICSETFGEYIPTPFYRGFPDTVRGLSRDQIVFDQLLHYYNTYGLGDFSEPGHSVFESAEFKRAAFKEGVELKKFNIVSEKNAVRILKEYFNDLCRATRPLSTEQFGLIVNMIDDYKIKPNYIASKNTAIKILMFKRDPELSYLIEPADVIDLVDEINYCEYGGKSVKKLNLKNKDRKFITKVLDNLFDEQEVLMGTWHDFFEQQAKWVGLLHHIHYKGKNENAKYLMDHLRSGVNESVYSKFERWISEGKIRYAIYSLKNAKGSTAVLRRFNYILSKCQNEKDIAELIGAVSDSNPIALMQLMMSYSDDDSGLRTFVFNKHNLLKCHKETFVEADKRKTRVDAKLRPFLQASIRSALEKHYNGNGYIYNKIFIDPKMKDIALPIEETTSSSGYGILPKGSRITVPAGKIIRLFTYWEKVNDIDLSLIGIDEKGTVVHEFSWRTMHGWNGTRRDGRFNPIIFSGDETSGYNGGSEYFDVHLERFKKMYPNVKYLVACNNVYSSGGFNNCFCRAGYMLRDELSSGEIYEPKTVKTAFTINADSSFAYLFAFDLEERKIVWLNTAKSSNSRVSGDSDFAFLTRYFKACDVLNLYDFFKMFAKEETNDVTEADLIISDDYLVDYKEGAKQVKSSDTEEILRYMNL